MFKMICSKCNKEKGKECFYVYHKSAGFPSVKNICRECRRIKSNIRYSKNKKSIRKKQNNEIQNITDYYICHSIFKSKLSDIPKTLIEAKRAQLKLLRHIKDNV